MPSFSIKKRLKSFSYALDGIQFMLKTQHNAWIHLAITMLTTSLGLIKNINTNDWRWLVVAIALVWFAETINTAFEFLCDVVSPDLHHSVKKAKDIAAGAVLICAIGAAILGILIFLPYFY
ncbi:diacylglycerol kinase family protein [Methylotenera sp.]|uniref:diacylglycerol kinase family protein n=1 Tax=Methylotenera sp. TaxID=2051956 RepID=UPI002489999F|nr:diacylglycerol kinase family protein [Methylotenera sp.]MDI1297865.1 diacylglycerol kinase family protein [Methylotenera sp.]